MPSLSDQSVEELGGRWSILHRQKRDHARLDRLLERLNHTEGVEQDAVLNRVARLVFPHAFAEEAVLWPQLRRRLPDGEALTLQVEQEHQEVSELWTRLEATSSPSVRRVTIDRLVAVLRQDVRDEEDELLPRLQTSLGARRLRLLGIAWEVVRRTAPTRPHPVVSRRPPGNVVAALPLTVLDRGRDAVDAAARRGPIRLRPAMCSASETIARTAGRVEQVGAMRRGEHGSTRRA